MRTAAEIRAMLDAERLLPPDAPRAPRHEFLVPEGNLPDLRKKLDKMIARAAKLGLAPITYEVGDFLDEKMTRSSGRKVLVRKYAVRVEGARPKLAGWEFAATLQHLDGGENIIRAIGEHPVPAHYRDAGPTCEHCKLVRQRIDTYLVRHDGGEWKQVGKTCIADFLGGPEGDTLARMAEYLADALDAAGAGEDERLGSGGKPRYPLSEALTLTAAAIKQFGWVSRKQARAEDKMATADIVDRNLWDDEDKLKKYGLLIITTPEHAAKAEAALAWAQSISDADVARSDYLHNLRVIASQSAIEPRLFGYACSIVSSYEREMSAAQEAKHERRVSAHVGEIGKRLEGLEITIVTIRRLESDFGVKTMIAMIDDAGNRFKWWASGGSGFQVPDAGATPDSSGAMIYRDAQEGERLVIKGTVKKHDEYKGLKETTLTRCAVFTPKAPKTKRKAD